MIEKAFTLPNGQSLKNRILKGATSERLALQNGAPSEQLMRAYEVWAEGGAGALITGNVMVDSLYLEAPRNVILEDDKNLERFSQWAHRCHEAGAKVIMQISHPGRQSPRRVTSEPLAPSSVSMKNVWGLAAQPRALLESEIHDIIHRFVNTATLAHRAGFDGVQVHAAHGYLLSEFLSPSCNRRNDQWGGSLENRMRILQIIIEKIRAKLPADLILSVKINSSDFQRGGFTETESLEVCQKLEQLGVDFIEISGGSYESTAMFGLERDSTRNREAYFSNFAELIRKKTDIPIMLTGGFRSQQAMDQALEDNIVDLIGMVRPLIAEPQLPNKMFAKTQSKAIEPNIRHSIKILDDLFQMSWYVEGIHKLGTGRKLDPQVNRWWLMLKGIYKYYLFNPLQLLSSNNQQYQTLSLRRSSPS